MCSGPAGFVAVASGFVFLVLSSILQLAIVRMDETREESGVVSFQFRMVVYLIFDVLNYLKFAHTFSLWL